MSRARPARVARMPASAPISYVGAEPPASMPPAAKKRWYERLHDYLKEKKIISRLLATGAQHLPDYAGGLTKASSIADTLGYSRRRRRGRRSGPRRLVGGRRKANGGARKFILS
jgi:hypothetical protein